MTQRKVFVVTGAGPGSLGEATAAALREHGRVITTRSSGPATDDSHPLDLADAGSVASFADWLAGATDRVDVLVNNAGVMAVPYGTSADGVELHLATNHVGHFALTNLLLPRLTDRVVVVGSQAHRRGELDLDDLDWKRRGYRPFAAYAASKLANLLFLGELQRRLTAAGSTLRATGAHPGSTATSITGSTGSGIKTWVGSLGHKLTGMPAWRGALTTVYAATMDVPGNTYIGPDGPREMTGWPVSVGRSRAASDPGLARALWERSEELTGVSFPL